ncbi:MAG: hypothetical protein Q4B63_05170 [Clostridium perfringens]|nr:hypothetical protein [Clostridium perfringens]
MKNSKFTNRLLEIIFLIICFQVIFLYNLKIIGIVLLIIYSIFKYHNKKTTLIAYKGAIAFNSKDYDKALELYEKAYNMKKVNTNIKLRYAYIALYCGKLNLCKNILDSVDYSKLKDSKLKMSYKQTEGLYLWKSNNLEKAIEIYGKLHAECEHTIIYEALGYLLILSKDYEKALKYNIKAFDYDNTNVIIDNLAQSYYYLGNLDKAKELYLTLFSKEKDKRPTFPEPYYYYGLILKEEGNLEDSFYYLNKALDKKESFLSNLNKDTILEAINDLEGLKISSN